MHVSVVPKDAKGDIKLPQADGCEPPAIASRNRTPVLCETNILHH